MMNLCRLSKHALAVPPRLPYASRTLNTRTLRPWSTHKLTTKLQSPESRILDGARDETSTAPGASKAKTNIASEKPSVDTRAKRRPLRPLKAAITLSPAAVAHLKLLLDSPHPKLIRIGVRNRGCSGLTYNLEYVEKPGKFDEEVVQDGVKVLIDSKALFSVIGSEMDWIDDKLSSRFVFHNPNSKGECGCGESFMV